MNVCALSVFRDFWRPEGSDPLELVLQAIAVHRVCAEDRTCSPTRAPSALKL